MAVGNRDELAQLCHQICNSLTQVMIASNLLQLDLQEILSAEQKRQFREIDEGAQQIRNLLVRLRHITESNSPSLKPKKSEAVIAQKAI